MITVLHAQRPLPVRYGCFVASVGMAFNFEVVAREFTFMGAPAHPAPIQKLMNWCLSCTINLLVLEPLKFIITPRDFSSFGLLKVMSLCI